MIRIFFTFLLLIISSDALIAQQLITRTIKSFGAKGDGKTNDSYAFEKAATFFNTRRGYGKLIINKGIYIVGRQIFNNKQKGKHLYSGRDIFKLDSLINFTIEGEKGNTIKFRSNLKFGSFDPQTQKAYTKTKTNFYKKDFVAEIGSCIYLTNCKNVNIIGVNLDGNNRKINFGGIWGDKGIQLYHYGILVINSSNIRINNCNSSYFGLDGIAIWNKPSEIVDNIQVTNSVFQYNSRQGMSWMGGNDLLVRNCKFNHTGRSKYASAPSAGLDIEATETPVRNGVFENCEFINNVGCGLTADAGDNANCRFTNCTFWGTTTFSAWVKMPNFNFYNCRFYGTFVHGYKANNDDDATKFFNCIFEDKPYKGKDPFGRYLVEANNARRMLFDSCTFISNKQKLTWIQLDTFPSTDDYYRMYNNTFVVKSAVFAKGDFLAVLRRVRFKNNTVKLLHPLAKNLYQWPAPCCTNIIDMGENKVIFNESK